MSLILTYNERNDGGDHRRGKATRAWSSDKSNIAQHTHSLTGLTPKSTPMVRKYFETNLSSQNRLVVKHAKDKR